MQIISLYLHLYGFYVQKESPHGLPTQSAHPGNLAWSILSHFWHTLIISFIVFFTFFFLSWSFWLYPLWAILAHFMFDPACLLRGAWTHTHRHIRYSCKLLWSTLLCFVRVDWKSTQDDSQDGELVMIWALITWSLAICLLFIQLSGSWYHFVSSMALNSTGWKVA